MTFDKEKHEKEWDEKMRKATIEAAAKSLVHKDNMNLILPFGRILLPNYTCWGVLEFTRKYDEEIKDKYAIKAGLESLEKARRLRKEAPELFRDPHYHSWIYITGPNSRTEKDDQELLDKLKNKYLSHIKFAGEFVSGFYHGSFSLDKILWLNNDIEESKLIDEIIYELEDFASKNNLFYIV